MRDLPGMSEGILNAINDISAGGNFLLDTTESCLYMSAKCREILGFSESQAINKEWLRPIGKEDGILFLKEWNLFKTRNNGVFQSPFQLFNQNQSLGYVAVRLAPVLEGGLLSGYYGTIEHIVGDHLAKEKLEKEIFILQSLLESTSASVFSFDHNFNYTAFNASHQKIMKIARGMDIKIGDNYTDVAGIDAGRTKDIFDEVMLGKTVESIEEFGEPGLYRAYFSMICNPMFNDQGEVNGMTVFCQDISERVKLQQEFEEQSLLLKGLLDNSPIMIYEVDPSGNFVRSGGAGLKAIGYKDGEILGRSAFEVFPMAEERLRKALSGEFGNFTTSLEKEGKVLIYQNHVFPHPDHKGNVIAFVLDITDQRAAEQGLRETQKELERTVSLLDATQEISKTGGWEFDVESKFVHRTKQLYMLWEHITEATSLEEATALYEEEEAINLGVRNALYLQQPFDMEVRPKNSEKWLRFICLPIMEHGNVSKLRGAIMDITDKKRAETELLKAKHIAEEAAMAKQQFLSNMSHEIRTPLNAVIGITHLLLQEGPKEEQEENLRTLKFSSDNLLSLINDILDYSKIEAGKIIFEDTDFHLAEFVNSLKHVHHLQAEKKEVSFKVNIDPQLPEMVVGDGLRLAQILNNLISNAVKFTPSGSVSLDIRLHHTDEEFIYVDFCVTDTGIGIDHALQEYIFESFTQASADTTRHFGGTGLGLAITKRLLNLQGSEISLDSSPGKGSEFSFRLPLKRSQLKSLHKKAMVSSTDFSSLAGYKVLLTEDNEVNILVASKFMQKWGLEIDYARTGLEAVEKIKMHSYDLILMDLQMPVMDGYTATYEIRAMEGQRFKNIPIIALTASVLAEIKVKVLESGMNDYLSKPFSPMELYSKIAHYLL